MLHPTLTHFTSRWQHVNQCALVKAMMIAFILILFSVLILDLFSNDMPEQVFAILLVFTGLLIFAQLITFFKGKWNSHTHHMAINPRFTALTITLALAGIIAVEQLIITPSAGIAPFVETIVIAMIVLIISLIQLLFRRYYLQNNLAYAIVVAIILLRLTIWGLSHPVWPSDLSTWLLCGKYFLNTFAMVLGVFCFIPYKR